MAGFEQADTQLAGVVQQRLRLRVAVDAGELWMDADVAERAARRCEQAVNEIDRLVSDAQPLTRRCKFGDNEDGNQAAQRFADAGNDYITTMKNAQRVFVNMAATFRAAGRTATEADEAGQQSFRSLPE